MGLDIKSGHNPYTEPRRISSRTIFRSLLSDQGRVAFAQLCCSIVIKKRQESIAATARHSADFVQKRAGKHHGPTRRRFEAARAIFGETDLATVKIIVQVDRNRKTAMGRARGGVVAVGREMPAILGKGNRV